MFAKVTLLHLLADGKWIEEPIIINSQNIQNIYEKEGKAYLYSHQGIETQELRGLKYAPSGYRFMVKESMEELLDILNQ